MRGGTSKGLFFLERHLPGSAAARERLFLAAMGSPDPYGRQLDGMGGGISSLSKVAIVGPSSRVDADVDFCFAQISVGEALVDYGGTCGNLMSAVGPFAVESGLVQVADGEASVRIHAVNTGKIVVAHFAVRAGLPLVSGSLVISGVAGRGAPVRLEFLAPGGARTGRLLPTGAPVDVLDLGELGQIRASLVDAANPCVFVRAADVGLEGNELPAWIDVNGAVMTLLEAIRAAAGVAMGFGADTGAISRASPASPKVAIVAPACHAQLLDGSAVEPAAMDVSIRMISMGLAHQAIPLTGALCSAVAARIPGTVVHHEAPPGTRDDVPLRIGTASGVLPVNACVEMHGNEPVARSASAYRTARRLMEGAVLVPDDEGE